MYHKPKYGQNDTVWVEPALRWHLMHEEPWFENHISTLHLRGREAVLKVDKPTPEDAGEPRLHTILEHRLA